MHNETYSGEAGNVEDNVKATLLQMEEFEECESEKEGEGLDDYIRSTWLFIILLHNHWVFDDGQCDVNAQYLLLSTDLADFNELFVVSRHM
ncbi:unnamed protein product [Angiostrongylus costaricensis]|uniref:Uncharacterized protein n=1 Tax=Angiostrongylus costaricensis TaxID=334426 RepID=A0A0R3PF85_ANGCS|nr:unnamed protein product [Angiostrongylus costaricensis]